MSTQDEVPAMLNSRPQTGLSFLAPEPEDLEDLYSRYKVCTGNSFCLCVTVEVYFCQHNKKNTLNHTGPFCDFFNHSKDVNYFSA